jgi:hypothetical protein
MTTSRSSRFKTVRQGVKKCAARAALVLAVALAAAGCSGLHAYAGPIGALPRLEISERMRFGAVADPTWRNMDGAPDPKAPAWVKQYTGHMINPTDRTVTIRIDCPLFILSGLVLPPRTVQDFVTEPDPATGALDCSFDVE